MKNIITGLLLLYTTQAFAFADRLIDYPLLLVHNPRVEWMLINHTADQTCRILARYDAVIANASQGINTNTVPVWTCVRGLNPKQVLFLQWPIHVDKACTSLPTQVAALSTFLTSLGNFVSYIDGVELDGAGAASIACGQPAVMSAIADYRAVLSVSLTVNSVRFPFNYAPCEYVEATEGTGQLNDPALLITNGSLEERWVAGWIEQWYLNGILTGIPKIKGRVDEACAWTAQATAPNAVWALHEICTPQWTNGSTPCAWSNARLGWALAQMHNRIVIAYQPYNTGAVNDAIYGARAFWLDYNAVCLNTGKVPSYGADKISSHDDGYNSQRVCGNYLGAPIAPSSTTIVGTGVFMSREFANAFVYANASVVAQVVTPLVPTKKVNGQQDHGYDDGSSATSYTVPPMDGLVLLKQQEP